MHRIYLLFISLFACASASLLAIDYGGEWIKASVIKPGVPFDVLLNRDSKRKIQSSVGWKGEDRLFGSDAFSIASRFPVDSFSGLKLLQGRPFQDDPLVEFYTKISHTDIIETSRGTVGFRRSPLKKKKAASESDDKPEKEGEREWSTEELIAMQLSYVKDLADSLSGKTTDKVKDVVLTVPPFYTQHERQALADAVDIAGLKLLALIHDGTAVAVNYAMTRSFPEKEWHIIYDAGATSITATLVSFSSSTNGKGSSKNQKNGTEITVAASAFERTASGMELDRRMRDLLVDDFNTKFQSKGVDLRKDPKGMTKMWKEAGRVKTILSANSEASSNVESIAFDIDYRSKISRKKFEDACSDLHSKFAQPIFGAIAKAGLELKDISSVILTGGASRTPMIQNAVKAAVGEKKMAANVNADEAAVLGAALYGASLSRQVKTKEMKVNDIGLWDLVVGYPSGSDSSRIINTLVFSAGSKFSSKKTLTLKQKDDFTVKVAYKYPELVPSADILSVEVTGVAEAIGNMTERLLGVGEPVVKLTVEMDKDGFISIPEAIVWGDVKDDTIVGKIKSLFGGSSNTTEEEEYTSETKESEPNVGDDADKDAQKPLTTPGSEETPPANSESATTTTSSSKPTPTLSAKERSTIKLKAVTTHIGIPPLTKEEKRKSRTRLINLDSSEQIKRRKEEARNNLEGYLYRLRDLLEGDSQSIFMNCSTEDERRKLQEKSGEVWGWMSEHGDDASTGELWEKKDSIEALEKPIHFRHTEREAFPQALSDIQQAHWACRMFLQSAADNATAEVEEGLEPKYKPAELQEIERKLKESETWLNDGVEKQKTLVNCNDGDPILLTAEMNARGHTLQREVMKLLKRKAPRKKVSSTTTTTSTQTATAESTKEPTTTPLTQDERPGRGEL